MRPALRCLSLATAAFVSLLVPGPRCQTPSSVSAPTAPTENVPAAPALTTSTRLVLVDVVVKDHNGHPVRNLSRDAFHLSEDRAPQNLRSFEEVNSSPAATSVGPNLPKLPPGIYSDLQPRLAAGALNILLIDALNTPTPDQTFLLEQLRHYLQTAPAGTPTAIFGLNTGLILLQGFTTDPALLRAALDHKSPKAPSRLLPDPNGTNGAQPNMSDAFADLAGTLGDPGMAAGMLAALQQFEARTTAFQLQNRVQYTLDAFEVLGHYLAALPGRKNLVWFSGSFPLEILPDPNNPDTFAPTQSNEAQLQDVVDLLTRAQVAVYPVDARSVRNAPIFDAAAGTPRFRGNNPTPIASEVAGYEHEQTSNQGTMKALATQTGGQAFYNTNDLAGAVAAAVDSGSHFYSLSYTPANTHWNNAFRSIRVELSPEANQRGYTLAYRRGYYATAPDHALHGNVLPTDEAAVSRHLLAASMSHGAPAPAELYFKVQVRPSAAETEAELTAGSIPGPQAPPGPFRRYSLDFVTLPQELSLIEDEKGIRSGRLELLAFVLGPDGELRIQARKALALNLPPQTFVALRRSGLRAHMEISAPAGGSDFLRIGVRDLRSRKMGVVELPLADVRTLAPLAAAPEPGTTSNMGPAGSSSDQTAPVPAAPGAAAPTPAPTAPQ